MVVGKNRQSEDANGFTIVELLIVVVVIAILAAITIVAYNGIQNRAKESSLQSSTSQASKKVAAYAALNSDTYPSQATFLADTGLSNSSDVTYDYYVRASDSKSYCVSASGPNTSISSFSLTSFSGSLNRERCILNMETNPSSEAAAFAGAGAGSNTRTVSPTQKFSGTNSTRFTWVSGSAGIQSSIITVQPSTTYFVSLYVYGESGALPVFNVAASDYATNSVTMNGSSAIGSWQRISRTYTTTAAQTTLRTWTTVGSASTFYADAILIAALPSGSAEYNDGNSADWVWNGATNASTSFGPAVITP